MNLKIDDWDEDEYDEGELVEDDYHDEDVNPVAQCPACGAEVYEDAEQCPSCGDYIVFSKNPWSGRSWWWISLGILGSAALIVLLIFA